MKKIIATVVAAAMTLAAGSIALAQSYPDKPVKLVLAYPPGGSSDPIARALGAGLAKRLGQPVVVENKTGGNTIIATQYVASSAPDGYTLYLTQTTPYTMVPHMVKKLPYDPVQKTPIALLAEATYAVAVPYNSPYRSLKELVDGAKARPGKLSFPSPGTAQLLGLFSEQFKASAGIDVLHVPYNGAGPTITAMLAGQHDFIVTDLGLIAQYQKTSKLRLLAVLANKRHPEFPDHPTVAEAGFKDIVIPPPWFGVVGPAGMPQAVVDKLNEVINEEMKSPEMGRVLNSYLLTVSTGKAQKLTQYLDADEKTWSAVIRKLGVQID